MPRKKTITPGMSLATAAALMGKRGGLSKGKSKTPMERSEHARYMANTRWAKTKVQVGDNST